jgi:hypothetical protein
MRLLPWRAPHVEAMTQFTFRVRKLVLWLLPFVLLLALGYAFRVNIFRAIGSFLVVSDRLEHADLILLLNGDIARRPEHAAKLFHQGWAPVVMIARSEDSIPVKAGVYPNVTDTSIAALRKFEVPATAIVQLQPPGGVAHTFDEAKALLEYLHEHPARKVIIVTSDLHSRRARFIFRRVLAGTQSQIMLAPVSDLKYGASNWWRSEDGVIGCQNEYIKLFYYHLRY